MIFALIMGAVAAYAQQGSGDYYEGLSRKIGFSQMIPPHGLEITYDKTVHIIFPSPVRYVDLGSPNLIAGKADGAENVIRVKATRKHFRSETNMSVITEDGNFYTFNVKYADEPLLLNVEMCDFIHDGESVNRPNNAMEIYLQELAELLYFHTEVKNATHVPFDVDFVTFKIVDKKIVKRTAMQEQVIYPLRAFNYVTRVDGKKNERTVFALPKFTIPDGKKLVVEMYEKQGGRHQSFEVENEDLVRAGTVNELKVR